MMRTACSCITHCEHGSEPCLQLPQTCYYIAQLIDLDSQLNYPFLLPIAQLVLDICSPIIPYLYSGAFMIILITITFRSAYEPGVLAGPQIVPEGRRRQAGEQEGQEG